MNKFTLQEAVNAISCYSDKKWKTLSDDDIWVVANSLGEKKEWDYPVGFARAIEQALINKNT